MDQAFKRLDRFGVEFIGSLGGEARQRRETVQRKVAKGGREVEQEMDNSII